MNLLLDTCAAIWIAKDEPIAETARQSLVRAVHAGESIFVSPITPWEIGLLVVSRRISLPTSRSRWFSRLMQAPGMILAGMEPSLLIASSALPGTSQRDPADRIILSTAREHLLQVVTRDRLPLNYAAEGHCRALAC